MRLRPSNLYRLGWLARRCEPEESPLWAPDEFRVR